MKNFKYVLGAIVGILLVICMMVYFLPSREAITQIQSKTGNVKQTPVRKGNRVTTIKFVTTQLYKLKWNTPDGVAYVQVPGANLGITSFYILDKNHIALLSDATNEIIIVNRKSESVFKRFPVVLSPRDFTYDNGYYYVLCETTVFVYNAKGENTSNFEFPQEYSGTMKLFRYENSTFLMLPSGNSLKIESGGKLIKPKEYEGWVTSNGLFIKTKIKNNYSYTVDIFSPNGENSSHEFQNKKKVAGVYVIGGVKNRIVLEIQTFLSEEPIKVERNIQIIRLNGIHPDTIAATLPISSSFYVLSNKDIAISNNGTIFNLVTKPQGAYVYSIEEYE